MTTLGAVIGFFSPCGYKKPKKHLQTTVAHLLRAGISVAVAQIVRPGQKPEPVPTEVASRVWCTQHTFFYKENLWNLGAELLPHENLLFIDSDILIEHVDLSRAVCDSLKQYDVIQPFEIAAWQNQSGDGIELRRRSAAFALAADIDPRPDRYHPGFAWALTRDAFKRINGWYDMHPAGGGDTAMSYAFAKREYGENWSRRLPRESYWWHQPIFQHYKKQIEAANLKIGYLSGVTATHLWHGHRKNRQYVGRAKFLPPTPTGKNFPLIRRQDGLLEWTSIEYSAKLQAYFDARLEDG